MLRIPLFAVTLLLCASACFSSAHAATEYCAASLRFDVQNAQPQSTQDVTLWSQAPHRLSGALQFYTASGWYGIDLAALDLQPTHEIWRMNGFAYPVTDWTAGLRVTFPAPVDIIAAVFAPQTGERCLAFAKPGRADAAQPAWRITAAALVQPIAVAAEPISPPGRTDCAQPFAEATETEAVPPQFPQRFLDRGFDRSGTLLSVAVDARGALHDAWFLSPSGFYEIDQSAMRAAHLSGYRAATLFCAPAPGVYLYQATFHAN